MNHSNHLVRRPRRKRNLLMLPMILIVGIFASLGAMPVVIFNSDLISTDNVRFEGVVMDVYTEFKLAGVKVSTGKVSTTTDAKGHFVLTVPASQQKPFYKISFAKKGYMKDYRDSIPAADSNEKILFGMMRAPK